LEIDNGTIERIKMRKKNTDLLQAWKIDHQNNEKKLEMRKTKKLFGSIKINTETIRRE
jgi:hypothetical protein